MLCWALERYEFIVLVKLFVFNPHKIYCPLLFKRVCTKRCQIQTCILLAIKGFGAGKLTRFTCIWSNFIICNTKKLFSQNGTQNQTVWQNPVKYININSVKILDKLWKYFEMIRIRNIYTINPDFFKIINHAYAKEIFYFWHFVLL